MPLLRLLIALTIFGGIALPRCAIADGATAGDSASTSQFVVYCYDRARDTVSRELGSACHGEVVSEEFAKAVEERRNNEIAHALQTEAQNKLQGLHLARIGTAFYVDEQARLLTNHHVIVDCKAVSIVETDRREIAATVLAVDNDADLALLGVTVDQHTVASFRSNENAAPDPFVAIVGYPDQGLPPIEPMITDGTLLRAGEHGSKGGTIVFRADVRHGNSGGPIFDSRGSVIGIVRAKIDTVRTFLASGRDIEDVGMGADLPAMLDFLRRNHVDYRETTGAGVLDDQEILATASKFVVRAECWN